MNIYYLTFVLLVSLFLGLLGLSLVFLPTKTLILKTNTWYRKITRTSPANQTQIQRVEPSLKNTALKKLQLISNDAHTLLFEESTYDQKTFSILYLMAPHNQEYAGYVLWQALMSQKLKYGSMKIFHAYEIDNTTGKILFSVANALEPGYFDADHIDRIKTPGLCFFMQLHALSNPLKTFEAMLKAAKRLEHLLGGTLCNHQRQPLSEAIIQIYYNKLASLAHTKNTHA